MKKVLLTAILLSSLSIMNAQNVDLNNYTDYIRVQKSGQSSFSRAFGLNGADQLYIGSIEETIGNIYFYNKGANHLMTIGPSGDVSIGTSAVSARLFVKQALYGGNAGVVVEDPAGRKIRLYGEGPSGRQVIGTANTVNPLAIEVNGVERVRFLSNGNVGIGTTSPSALLHLNQSGPSALRFDRGGHDRYDVHLAGSKGLYIVNTSDNRNEMVFDGNGNIGLGTETPLSPLHLKQSGPLGLRFERSGHDQYDIKVAGSKGLYFTNITDGREEMVFDGTGNVGIGTTTPDKELTVNGTIHSKEVIVDNNITPDYVFQKYYTGTSSLKADYTMPTLEEVAEFTKKNHHLPNVPSAKEISNDGMKLKEMTNLLLQKIEELTLYTIEQEKRIKALESQLSKKK